MCSLLLLLLLLLLLRHEKLSIGGIVVKIRRQIRLPIFLSHKLGGSAA
jgi:hypothetical protein